MRTGVRCQIPIGSVFGKWTVIGEPEKTATYGVYAWRCRCECGFESVIAGNTLRHRATSACRACAATYKSQRKAKDITGQQFGGWTAVREIPVGERPDALQARAWWCRCKCGKEQALSLPQVKDSEIGCKKCARRLAGLDMRLRPYEAVFNLARVSIINRISRKQVYEFTVSYEEFAAICETKRCYYCHVPLQWASHCRRGVSNAYKLDRQDNTLGYIPGNVVGCCKRCNYAKGGSYSHHEWWLMTECFRSGRLVPTARTATNWGVGKRHLKNQMLVDAEGTRPQETVISCIPVTNIKPKSPGLSSC